MSLTRASWVWGGYSRRMRCAGYVRGTHGVWQPTTQDQSRRAPSRYATETRPAAGIQSTFLRSGNAHAHQPPSSRRRALEFAVQGAQPTCTTAMCRIVMPSKIGQILTAWRSTTSSGKGGSSIRECIPGVRGEKAGCRSTVTGATIASHAARGVTGVTPIKGQMSHSTAD